MDTLQPVHVDNYTYTYKCWLTCSDFWYARHKACDKDYNELTWHTLYPLVVQDP